MGLNPAYLIPRVVRHFLPGHLVRFLLARSWIIRPGLETSDSGAAVQRYTDVLDQHGLSLKGMRVMVFGYGGRFDIGVALLEAGADSVVLCEKFAPPDEQHNRGLLPRYESHLSLDRGFVRPRYENMTLLQADIRDVKIPALPQMDLVISSSVYEHLEDVEGTTQALAALTRRDGLHIHFVDLRDHYFTYPFEMLCYSVRIWRGWLNPSSHHNRFRVWDYRRVFQNHFEQVELTVLERDEVGFERIRARIRPEFISGKLGDDSITLIRVVARNPASNL